MWLETETEATLHVRCIISGFPLFISLHARNKSLSFNSFKLSQQECILTGSDGLCASMTQRAIYLKSKIKS